MKKLLCLFVLLALTVSSFAAEPAFVKKGEELVKLPEAVKTGGMSLREALANRQTQRKYVPGKEFDLQQLSDLLWAAAGVNRENGRLTAPTARNWQEVELYVCLPQGVYYYNKKAHSLELKLDEDIRKLTGPQPFVGENTIEIILVVDTQKMQGCDVPMYVSYGYIDSGYISQNIYLYAAAENLATVVRGMTPREELLRKLQLPAAQFVTVVQTVGFAK